MTSEPISAWAWVALKCPTHGRYEGYRAPDVAPVAGFNDCPRCIDELQATRERERRGRGSQLDRRARIKELVDGAGIPRKFATVVLADYQATVPNQRLALNVCQNYAKGWDAQLKRGGSLVFTGGPGTGKTHLASAIANTVMTEHVSPVLFGTAADLLLSIRATYRNDGRVTESEARAALIAPDLLIIDEIGAHRGTEHELQLLFEIINARYQQSKPMIAISNLTSDELGTFLGQRVMDRFTECATQLAFNWSSYRLSTGQQVPGGPRRGEAHG